ncbi:MinD/ParA family protein [Microbacterium oryzae]|uniref:MinD/ParA family ATP-binding protein n=1 Tax=Microbacterium oryzae TaxID=743009 RepID=UPI0025B0B954|nr:MinD/ParA family protein [Microbacterium oryzae]MDN3311915.1 MinD/ParA family protein [Microbacterium oryzae]
MTLSSDRGGRPDAEPADNGVLGGIGLDTTAIGVLGAHTAQVQVALPPNREDPDDDVVDDDDLDYVMARFDELKSDEVDAADHADPADDDTLEPVEVDADEVLDETEADVGAADRAEADAAEAIRASQQDPAVLPATPAREETLPRGYDSFAARPLAVAAGADAREDTMPDPTEGARPDPSLTRPSFVTPHAPLDAAAPEAVAARRAGEVTESATRESADVLTADRLLESGAVRRPEPEGPWRQLVYRATRGVVNLGDSRAVRERKDVSRRIAVPLVGAARFVPVLSRKGGVGKTTVTALLGMALADARDDRVIAVDANPDRGTLAERIARSTGRTVRDLVRNRDSVRGYAEMSAHVVRDETRLDVLASDTDPRLSEAFSDQDYRTVADVAAHYYSIVLTDTGTGIVQSVMGATLDLADQIVVVAGLSVDEARLASETLTWLEANGHSERVRHAVVVLNQSTPGAPVVRLDELETHFRSRVRAVVRLPYDPQLATGSAITYAELRPATRDAARVLAARVIEGLRPQGAEEGKSR